MLSEILYLLKIKVVACAIKWQKYDISLCFNLQVDVIVNTIATNCKLDQGEISKAISKKAGRKIQDEISKMKNAISFSGGVLYMTHGHDLKCLSVYHTALTEMSQKVDSI